MDQISCDIALSAFCEPACVGIMAATALDFRIMSVRELRVTPGCFVESLETFAGAMVSVSTQMSTMRTWNPPCENVWLVWSSRVSHLTDLSPLLHGSGTLELVLSCFASATFVLW